MVILPVEAGVPFQSFETELDGTLYGFELQWNERAASWLLHLYDSTGAVLRLGMPCAIGARILGKRRPATHPQGELLVVAVDGGGPPGLEDFGQDARVRLVYAPKSEVPTGGPA